MILVVNVCKEGLHYYEFVRPIEDIIRRCEIDFFTKHYSEIDDEDLRLADKIIICGTSLGDNQFAEDYLKFKWLAKIDKPVLGICAGMQLIGFAFGGKMKKQTEVGFLHEFFEKKFLGLEGEVEVYHLHNNYIDFYKLKDFEVFAGNKIAQAVKHKNKEIYGVLFHPEVRQKDMVAEFVNSFPTHLIKSGKMNSDKPG